MAYLWLLVMLLDACTVYEITPGKEQEYEAFMRDCYAHVLVASDCTHRARVLGYVRYKK